MVKNITPETAQERNWPDGLFETYQKHLEWLVNSDTGRRFDVAGNLDGVDLSDLDLRSANLNTACLTRVNLSGTILTSADLRSTILTGANLTGAKLDLASLNSTISWSGVDFTDVILIGRDGMELSIEKSREIIAEHMKKLAITNAKGLEKPLDVVSMPSEPSDSQTLSARGFKIVSGMGDVGAIARNMGRKNADPNVGTPIDTKPFELDL